MNVILEGREPCPSCGWQASWILSAGVRVNKGSIRSTGMTAGACLAHHCLECGFPLASDSGPRLWRFDAKSRTAVDEFRQKRGWL